MSQYPKIDDDNFQKKILKKFNKYKIKKTRLQHINIFVTTHYILFYSETKIVFEMFIDC